MRYLYVNGFDRRLNHESTVYNRFPAKEIGK